ncbi:MAG: hypothetical protein ACTHMY_16700 [Solirubrobacteraceae bacterium]
MTLRSGAGVVVSRQCVQRHLRVPARDPAAHQHPLSGWIACALRGHGG